MEKASKIISRREFQWLSTFKHLTPEEEKKVKDYQEHHCIDKTSQIEKKAQKKADWIDGEECNLANIWKAFKFYFEKTTGSEFIQTEDSLKNIEPVLKYFAKDDSFFNCENLLKQKGSRELSPSFDKGLLIVGNYGNGKTTIMKSLSMAFSEITEKARKEYWKSGKKWNDSRFLCHNANNVVTEYESLTNPEYKDNFYKKYKTFRLYFDDVKNEKVASNFGKTEIIREILEKRYDLGKKTFITCNYNQNYPNDLDQALDDFGIRYGGHIYDRLFQMFNIIEFEGKTFRK